MNPEKLERKLQALEQFHDDTARIINDYDAQPVVGSQAHLELNTPLKLPSGLLLPSEENLTVAFLQANLFIESSADHLIAFRRSFVEPILTMAPWTCLRAIIESAALASWLINPKDNPTIRIGRGFAFRYEDISQQKALANSRGDSTGSNKAKTRLDEIERDALTFGYTSIVDRNGKRDGIGQRIPNLSDLVKQTLDQEDAYRVASGIIHSTPSAITQLGFQKNNGSSAQINRVPVVFFEKGMPVEMINGLCHIAALSFARPTWLRCDFYGWDQTKMRSILDNVANALEIDLSQRFWANTAAS